MLSCLKIQFFEDLKRIQNLMFPTLMISTVFSIALNSPFIFEPVFTYIGVVLTIFTIEFYSTTHSIRIFSCNGAFNKIRILSMLAATYLSAIFAVFTVTGFLNITGLHEIPADMLGKMVMFIVSFTSISILGTFYITAFFSTLILAFFAVTELSFVISGGREAFLEVAVNFPLSHPQPSLLLFAASITVLLRDRPSLWHPTLGDFSALIGKFSPYFSLFASAIRYYFLILPVVLIPTIYTFYSDEGVEFAYMLSAALVAFLLNNLSVKSIEKYTIAGLEKLLLGSTLLTTTLIMLNAPISGINTYGLLSVVEVSAVSGANAIAFKLRKSDRTFTIFALIGLILLGVVYHSPISAFLPVAIFTYFFLRRC
ncbi:hypothetical protein [Archaeoglobus sp.]|uniref:hypothetical protein n=1 Tax=Archaeoglobus sp. TaxID=1872626 RepID=UPI0024AC1D89|nr:hypothetical protein [Archaeoglobus sp.]MDI3498865.1 hypothetical protein [Archaeoglobus sp.]